MIYHLNNNHITHRCVPQRQQLICRHHKVSRFLTGILDYYYYTVVVDLYRTTVVDG